MKSHDKQIPPLIFTAQLGLYEKCPLILIRLKNLKLNKALFVSVRPGT
jgi:hypothetical protein